MNQPETSARPLALVPVPTETFDEPRRVVAADLASTKAIQDKLFQIQGAVGPIIAKRDLPRSMGNGKYASESDILDALAPHLEAARLNMSSSIESKMLSQTEYDTQKETENNNVLKVHVVSVRIEIVLITMIADIDTGAFLIFRHEGIGEDASGEKALKEANTSAKGLMLRNVFNLRINDGKGAFLPSAAGSRTQTQADPARPTGAAAKNPCKPDQLARIKILGESRGIALDSDQMTQLVLDASNKYCRVVGENLSYPDAERLIKALEAIPLPANGVAPTASQEPTTSRPELLKAVRTANGIASNTMSATDMATVLADLAQQLGGTKKSLSDYSDAELSDYVQRKAPGAKRESVAPGNVAHLNDPASKVRLNALRDVVDAAHTNALVDTIVREVTGDRILSYAEIREQGAPISQSEADDIMARIRKASQ